MTDHAYREVTPPSDLSEYIEACWFYQRDFTEPRPDILVPEGVVDIIFNFGAPYFRRCLTDSDRFDEWISSSVLVGQRTRLFQVRWPQSTRLFGIRLRAESAYCLNNGSMKGTANRTFPLEDSPLADLNVLTRDFDFDQQDTLLTHCLELFRRKSAGFLAPDRRLSAAIGEIRSKHGNVDLNTLCEVAGTHRRTLERLFVTRVGVTPKFFARALRLHYFLYLHRTRSSDSMTSSLHGAKYYDQSHFIREFKAFTGHTPATFFASPPEIYEPLVKSLMAKFNEA